MAEGEVMRNFSLPSCFQKLSAAYVSKCHCISECLNCTFCEPCVIWEMVPRLLAVVNLLCYYNVYSFQFSCFSSLKFQVVCLWVNRLWFRRSSQTPCGCHGNDQCTTTPQLSPTKSRCWSSQWVTGSALQAVSLKQPTGSQVGCLPLQTS